MESAARNIAAASGAEICAALVLGAGLLLGAGCAPPPDPDGTPMGSKPLALDEWHRDSLDCSRSAGDCADWYYFETPAQGSVRIDLAKVQDERKTPDFSLVLGESSGRVIVEERNMGRTRLLLTHPAGPGEYANPDRFTLAVRTPPDGGGALEYEVRVSFREKPKPRARSQPRFRQVRATLLELESRPDGSEAVLLDRGSRAGIARGQRGRLLQDGKRIADLEVLDVYPDGSRALIRGGLSAAITPSTVAEVDVPE